MKKAVSGTFTKTTQRQELGVSAAAVIDMKSIAFENPQSSRKERPIFLFYNAHYRLIVNNCHLVRQKCKATSRGVRSRHNPWQGCGK